MSITIGDCAEALQRIRDREGWYYNPSMNEILREAIR